MFARGHLRRASSQTRYLFHHMGTQWRPQCLLMSVEPGVKSEKYTFCLSHSLSLQFGCVHGSLLRTLGFLLIKYNIYFYSPNLQITICGEYCMFCPRTWHWRGENRRRPSGEIHVCRMQSAWDINDSYNESSEQNNDAKMTTTHENSSCGYNRV